MARNELFNLAYTQDYDIMVFIDDDEYWDEKALIEILKSDRDVITVPVVNKGDKEESFNIFLPDKIVKDEEGYIKTKKTGTGFLKLTRKVIVDLWESNTEVRFRTKTIKNICEYGILNGDFVGEDIALSRKINELGYTIWVYPEHTVFHIGNKMYKGDFKKSLESK